MNVVQAMVAELLERPAVNNPLGGRLYPNQVPPDSDYPCLVYRRNGNKQRRGVREGLKTYRTRIEIEIHGRGPRSYETACQIMDAVRDTLTDKDKGFKGVWGDQDGNGGVQVDGCMVDDDGVNGGEVDAFIPSQTGTDKGIDVITLTFWVEWEKA